jgi:perosamine synthetase
MKRIPWWSPQIGRNEYTLIKKVLKSNFPNEGKFTEEFEDKIAQLLHVKHALTVTSGTTAIYLSLKALGIGHGDEVIVPDISFIATANAVEMTGAKTVLTDIDPNTLMLDPKSFEKNITKKTKAVIPVHVSGRAADIIKIKRIADAKNISVIEDAAEAFMSKYKGQYLGTFGHTGCFSLSPAKIITTGQGGIITTNDDNLYLLLKRLKDQGRPMRGTGGDDIHEGLGFNFKFTDLQAAVGIGQLKYTQKRVARLKRNYELYKSLLSGIKQITIFDCDIEKGELPLWTDAKMENRDKLENYLRERGADCRKLWHPIHSQSYYKKSNKLFPNSTNLSSQSLWLPSAFTLKDKDIRYVCTLIKKFYDSDKA